MNHKFFWSSHTKRTWFGIFHDVSLQGFFFVAAEKHPLVCIGLNMNEMHECYNDDLHFVSECTLNRIEVEQKVVFFLSSCLCVCVILLQVILLLTTCDMFLSTYHWIIILVLLCRVLCSVRHRSRHWMARWNCIEDYLLINGMWCNWTIAPQNYE